MEDTKAGDGCPFCAHARASPSDRVLAYSMPDEYPLVAGHVLVVVTRHLDNLLDSTPDEWRETWALVRTEAIRALGEGPANGVNIGVNIGVPAGQTVEHAHVHIIPRTAGDRAHPDGGVRCVLEEPRADI